MASRDPRADIVENNPFPKPKISRIHSNQDSSNSTIYTMDDLKSMFTNKTQKKPQLKQVWEFSTIEKEKAYNPRLKVESADEYADIMNNLNLPDPKLMDVAIPRNLKLGEK